MALMLKYETSNTFHANQYYFELQPQAPGNKFTLLIIHLKSKFLKQIFR